MKVFGAYFKKKTSQVHNRKQSHRKVRILRRCTEDIMAGTSRWAGNGMVYIKVE